MSLFFSDSVITRVYYILLLEDGLLFAFSASLSIIVRVFLSQRLFLSLSFSLSFCYYVKFYSDSHSDSTICNSPPSYRQPSGNGQLLSRRYCTHSVWSFLCAYRTARESQGALAVSCKYFKQSKWPFLAAFSHTHALYSSYLRSTRYSSM